MSFLRIKCFPKLGESPSFSASIFRSGFFLLLLRESEYWILLGRWTLYDPRRSAHAIRNTHTLRFENSFFHTTKAESLLHAPFEVLLPRGEDFSCSIKDPPLSCASKPSLSLIWSLGIGAYDRLPQLDLLTVFKRELGISYQMLFCEVDASFHGIPFWSQITWMLAWLVFSRLFKVLIGVS